MEPANGKRQLRGDRQAGLVAARVSIGVLPFTHAVDDPGALCLSDALIEDLAAALSDHASLAVAGWSASFACRSFADDIERVLGELGVTHLLAGSVRRAGDQLDLTVRLLHGATTAPTWEASYQCGLGEFAGVPVEIARQVAARLTAPPTPRFATPPSRNLIACDLLLRGRSAIMRGGNADDQATIGKGIALAEQAAAREPHWPVAFRHLARGYALRAELRYFGPQAAADCAAAGTAARRQLALDSEDASAHALLGHLAMREMRHADALASLRHASALNPDDVMTLRWLAWEEANHELTDDARAHGEKALRLSPCDRLVPQTYWTLGLTDYVAGNLEACLEHARRAVAMRPRFAVHYIVLAACLAELGELSEAHYTLAAARTLSPWLVDSRLNGICYFVAPALTERYVRALQRASAGIEAEAEPQVSPANSLARLTQREHEVLRLVAHGHSNAAIAEALGISAHTAKRHIANMLAKLGVPTRAAAAGFAARNGVK